MRNEQAQDTKDVKSIKKEEKQSKSCSQNQSSEITQPLFLEVDHLVEIGSVQLTDFPGSPIIGKQLFRFCGHYCP
jgi:hypothetical protein